MGFCKVLLYSVTLLYISSAIVSATTGCTINHGLRAVALPAGWLFMVIQGLRWIAADSANERGDSKKGMIYIVIALLLVSSACSLMCVYCSAARQSLKTVPGIVVDSIITCDATGMADICCPAC
jgi:L-lysine 2,3-aminomutase